MSAPKHIVGCFVLKFWIFSRLILLNKLLSSSFLFGLRMRWTNEHDVIFLRTVLVHELWKNKYGSQKREKVWGKVAESLNSLNSVCKSYFKVTHQSAQDRYKLLAGNFKKREQEKTAASEISPEETEIDVALADITERFKEADEMQKKQTIEKKRKNEADHSTLMI